MNFHSGQLRQIFASATSVPVYELQPAQILDTQQHDSLPTCS